MNIYLASSYIKGEKIVKDLKTKLNKFDAKIFYPESINISAHTLSEMQIVNSICTDEIRKSNIFIAVYPFGISVSVEIGIFLESNIKNSKLIIFDTSEKDSEQYKKLRTEAMLIPHVYRIVYSIDELIKELY